mgnify:CR=1 FL=1
MCWRMNAAELYRQVCQSVFKRASIEHRSIGRFAFCIHSAMIPDGASGPNSTNRPRRAGASTAPGAIGLSFF